MAQTLFVNIADSAHRCIFSSLRHTRFITVAAHCCGKKKNSTQLVGASVRPPKAAAAATTTPPLAAYFYSKSSFFCLFVFTELSTPIMGPATDPVVRWMSRGTFLLAPAGWMLLVGCCTAAATAPWIEQARRDVDEEERRLRNQCVLFEDFYENRLLFRGQHARKLPHSTIGCGCMSKFHSRIMQS